MGFEMYILAFLVIANRLPHGHPW